MTTAALVALDVAWIIGASAAVGAWAPRWPDTWLDDDRFPVCRWPAEAVDRYRRVDALAALLPEGGRWFGGRSKTRMPGLAVADLRAHLREVRRAEWVHWWSIGLAFALFAVNPWWLAAAMVLGAVLVNSPFILVLRRNRLRLTAAVAARSDRP